MIALINWLPLRPFSLQYTNYEYGEFYDYNEGELTTDAPPTEGAKTEVTFKTNTVIMAASMSLSISCLSFSIFKSLSYLYFSLFCSPTAYFICMSWWKGFIWLFNSFFFTLLVATFLFLHISIISWLL